MILTVSALLGEAKSNAWALEFTLTYLIDQLIFDPLSILLKVIVLKSVLKKRSCVAILLKKTYLGGVIKNLRLVIE